MTDEELEAAKLLLGAFLMIDPDHMTQSSMDRAGAAVVHLFVEVTRLRAEVATLGADRDHARHVINAMQYDDVNSNEETFEIAAEYLREHRRPSDHWRVGQPVGEG